MKITTKIIGIILSLLLLSTAAILPVSAENTPGAIDPIYDAFVSYLEGTGHEIDPDDPYKDAYVSAVKTFDDYRVFLGSYTSVSNTAFAYERIGAYIFSSAHGYSPYDIGIFVLKDGIVYTLTDAHAANIINIDEIASEFFANADNTQDRSVHLIGDVTNDQSVDLSDILFIQQHVALIFNGNQIFNNEEFFFEDAADFNDDDEVDISDVLLMQKYVAKLVNGPTDKLKAPVDFYAQSDIYFTGAPKVDCIILNNSEQTFTYGDYFTLQKQNGAIWQNISFKDSEITFPDIAHVVPAHGHINHTYPLSNLFNSEDLTDGTYRITTEGCHNGSTYQIYTKPFMLNGEFDALTLETEEASYAADTKNITATFSNNLPYDITYASLITLEQHVSADYWKNVSLNYDCIQIMKDLNAGDSTSLDVSLDVDPALEEGTYRISVAAYVNIDGKRSKFTCTSNSFDLT